ncbi:hypothetical protein SAMN05444401_1498 [Clostridium amylolyticum]|uniref:DUF6199 domain-containing protein n=1 Tax=Clostridium amylolyticum TaxID=1121298 RepID=A0A1M6E9V7_9CLOT|nr:hypothetical protein [Clostridium amylolyticum]SHI82149.1 hypothetical protein SAMN05444401_1498 [Clostridium amylolyticum]
MIILRIILIALIILGAVSIKYPEETYMFGRRWMYKDDVELSEFAIDIIKFQGIIAIIFFSILFISTFMG